MTEFYPRSSMNYTTSFQKLIANNESMKNIYTISDYQKTIEFINSLPHTNEEKVKLVLALIKVFKSDNKNFRSGKFEECIWDYVNSEYTI